MNQFGVIFALVFSLIIAIFALANSQPVLINYLYGKAEVSAIVVILGAAISGALVIFVLNLVRHIKAKLQLRSLRNEIKSLHVKIRELEEERELLQEQLRRCKEASAGTGGPASENEGRDEGFSAGGGENTGVGEPEPSGEVTAKMNGQDEEAPGENAKPGNGKI